MASLTREEQRYVELRAKFKLELWRIDKEIEKLTERKEKLTALLDGEVEEEPAEETPEEAPVLTKQQIDDTIEHVTKDRKVRIENDLTEFVRENPGASRAQIDEFFADTNVPRDEIRMARDRLRRRGTLVPKGKSIATRWYLAKGV